MVNNLERRRQAIAEALRAVMSEPPPRRAAPAPVTPPAPVAMTPPAPVRSLRESLAAQIDWDEVDDIPMDADDAVESPPIPPLEIAGEMSRTASLALFGHA